MVTYNGRRVRLPVPRNLPLDLEVRVFSIPETGEWFLTYSSYLQRLDFYLQKSFRCEVTGTAGLTYFEAVGSEKRSTNFVEKTFSAGLRESIEKYVMSVGVNDVKALVPMILRRFENDFTIGELVVRKEELNKDSSEDTGVTSTNTTNTTTQYGEYIVREKVSFDEIVDEDTGEVLIPGYSKYLLVERPKKTRSADATTKGLIVDSSQIQRKVPLVQHTTLMQWFCRIVINKKNEQNEPSPWAQRGEEDGKPVTEQDNREGNPQDLEDTARNSEEPPTKKLKTISVEDSGTTPQLEDTEKSSSTVKNAVEDLYLPYQGPPNIFKNLYCLNSNLEYVPVNTLERVSDHNIDKYTDKLLQCYQFLSTFQTVLKLAPFSLDQLVISIKCTDPYELAGEKVCVCTVESENGNGNGNIDISRDTDSPWKRNPKVRSYIESLSNDKLSYKILRNKPVPEHELDEIDRNGAGLFVYIILSLLGLLKDSGGKWRCHIPEEWIEDDINGNNGNKEGIVSDQKDENSTLDGIIDKVLNFRSINWSDRLSRGQFENGFWVIILLGVFQDSMHITKYTKIVEKFTNAVLNKGRIPVIGFPKCLFRNFCRNLTIEDKVNVLWVLTDIVMNFSTDVHTALESSLKLSYELKYLREQLYRAKLKEEGKLTTMENQLQQLKKAMHSRQSFVVTEKEREVAEQQRLIAEMEESKALLSKVALEYEFINFKAIGMDRYGNRYYWFDLSGPPLLDPEEEQRRDNDQMEEGRYSPKYHSGRLWVKSPVDSIACWLLDITMEQLREWREVAKTFGKAQATKQVFKVYRKDNVYYKIDNGEEIPIVNSDGIINPEHQYTRIQRKIIDEGPENLLLLHEEWFCFDKLDDVGLLLSWLDDWGTREYYLKANLLRFSKQIESCYTARGIDYGTQFFSIEEDALIMRFNKFRLTARELQKVNALDNLTENPNIPPPKNRLLDTARQLVLENDCRHTRYILKELNKLEETRRTIQDEQANLLGLDMLYGLEDMDYEDDANSQALRVKKLRKQMEILTELMNCRHIGEMKHAAAWYETQKHRPHPLHADYDVMKNIQDVFQMVKTRILAPVKRAEQKEAATMVPVDVNPPVTHIV